MLNAIDHILRALIKIGPCLLLLVVVNGCTPVPPKVITISKTTDYSPSTPDDVKNVEQAIAAVRTAAAESGLPKIDSLSLWLYENSEAFAYWGNQNAAVHEVANKAAVTKANSIHINLGSLAGTRWSLRVGELAHEFGHVVHNSLADNQVKAPVWFREGFAEWVASRILDALKWRSEVLTTHRARRELNFQRGFEPSIFRDNEKWKLHLNKSGGFASTYTVAFVAVDRLIKKNGFAAAVEYLKTAEFEKSFGLSQSSFEAELEKSIIEDLHPKQEFRVDKPKWLVGFQWKYEVSQSGKTRDNVEEIVGTASTPHGSVFLLRDENEETARSTEDLGVLETRKNGVVTSRRDKSSRLFAWPLEAGKQWTNTYTLEDLESKNSLQVHRMMSVSGSELVKVPAGTFKAVKIEAYNYKTGRLVSEYWYSREVRWFVKTVSYEGPDTYYRQRQLISYRLGN